MNILNKESVSPSRKDTGVVTGESYSFQIDVYLGTSIEEEGGMETGKKNHQSSGSRLDQLEEMQRSAEHFYMGQNHALQSSDKKNGLR